jgi:hypothetical protein
VALFAPLNHVDQGSAELQLGLTLVELGRFDQAAEALDAALLHFEQRRSLKEPYIWTARAARALVARRLGDRAAGAALEAALAGFREHGLAGSSGYADSLLMRAQVAALDGDATAARRWHADALAALQALLGPEHPRVKAARAHPPEGGRSAAAAQRGG